MENAYATVEELRSAIQHNTGAAQESLELALEAASRSIDDFCNRRFWQDSEVTTRYYTALRTSGMVLTDDISTAVGLLVATDSGSWTWSTSLTLNQHYALLPRNAAADGRPWTALGPIGSGSFPCGADAVRVTAQFGWAAVPAKVKQATLLQAARLFRRKDSPFGVTGSPDAGGELRLLARLDPDVEALVKPYRLIPVA